MTKQIAHFVQDVNLDAPSGDVWGQAQNSSGILGSPLFILIVLILCAVFFRRYYIMHSKKHQRYQDFKRFNDSQAQQSNDLHKYNSFYVSEDGTIVRLQKNSLNVAPVDKVLDNQEEKNEAIALIRESAEAGVAEAQYYLGLCYEQGAVVNRDIELAKKWYRMSASQNFPQAKFRLGKILMEDK